GAVGEAVVPLPQVILVVIHLVQVGHLPHRVLAARQAHQVVAKVAQVVPQESRGVPGRVEGDEHQLQLRRAQGAAVPHCGHPAEAVGHTSGQAVKPKLSSTRRPRVSAEPKSPPLVDGRAKSPPRVYSSGRGSRSRAAINRLAPRTPASSTTAASARAAPRLTVPPLSPACWPG